MEEELFEFSMNIIPGLYHMYLVFNLKSFKKVGKWMSYIFWKLASFLGVTLHSVRFLFKLFSLKKNGIENFVNKFGENAIMLVHLKNFW